MMQELDIPAAAVHVRVSTHPKTTSARPAVKVEFFEGAFVYHWHNCWDAEIHPESYAGWFMSLYEAYMSGAVPNIYKEYVYRTA